MSFPAAGRQPGQERLAGGPAFPMGMRSPSIEAGRLRDRQVAQFGVRALGAGHEKVLLSSPLPLGFRMASRFLGMARLRPLHACDPCENLGAGHARLASVLAPTHQLLSFHPPIRSKAGASVLPRGMNRWLRLGHGPLPDTLAVEARSRMRAGELRRRISTLLTRLAFRMGPGPGDGPRTLKM